MWDVKNIKPGWSLSKVSRYLPEAGGCPRRFALLDIDQRWDEEPKSEYAGIGTVVAALMRQWRWQFITAGTDPCVSRAGLEIAAKKAAADEKIPDAAREKALDIFFNAVPYEFGRAIMPPRERIRYYWLEERLAFRKDWSRIPIKEADAKWWGTKEQRAETYFRAVPDFAWIDEEDVLHVEDDKALFGKVRGRQVQSYGFALSKVAEAAGKKIRLIQCQYNLLSLGQDGEGGKGKVLDAGSFAPSEVQEFPRWLASVVETILADSEFKPNVGKACDYCGFMGECPAYLKVGREVQTIKPDHFRVPTTLEDAEKLGLWILVGEAVVSAAKAAARKWVEEHGPVALPATDKEMRLNPATVREAPAGPILGALVQAAIPRDVILSRVVLKPGDVEDVLKGVYPLSGKGVTKEVREANRAARDAVEASLSGLWTEKPRAPTFGIFTRKDVE